MRACICLDHPRNFWLAGCAQHRIARLTVCIAAMLAMVWVGSARADDLVAVHSGLMCRSASALEKLTRDDGSARTNGKHAAADDVLKVTGGCLDVAPGLHVQAVKINVGTSVVTCLIGGLAQQFTVANIDFAPVQAASRGQILPGGAPAAAAANAPPPAADAPLPVDAPATVPDPDAPPPLSATDLALLTPPSAQTPPQAAAVSSSNQQSLSVTGLTLGMTEDAAEARLAGYRFATEQALGDPAMTHIAADGPDPGNSYRLGFIGGKLWFINHMMAFPAGRQPYLPRLIGRLAAKYGTPSRVSQSAADGYRAWWQFNADGSPMHGTVAHCLADAAPTRKLTRPMAANAGFEVNFTNDCPITVSAMALPDATATDHLARLEIILAEPQPVYLHLRAEAAALAQQRMAETDLATGTTESDAP